MSGTMPKGIAQKVVRLMAQAGTIEKRGRNQNQKYDFVQEADLVNKIRPAMAEMGLMLHQTTVHYETQPMYETRSGGTMYLTTVGIAYRWIDAETGEVYDEPGIFYGTGADTGDKGVYKAATGSLKYFLMKSLLIGSGDDPEADEKVDQHAALGAADGRRVMVTKAPAQGVQKGGHSEVATDAQRQELKRIAKSMGIGSVKDLMGLVNRVFEGDGKKAPYSDSDSFLTWLQEASSVEMGKVIVAAGAVAAAGVRGADLDLS